MTVKLKWDGDRLMLGRTVMAGVRKDDCLKDCESHVRRLLAKAGAPDA